MSVQVIDIETTGSHPWLHELVAIGINETVYRPAEGMEVVSRLLSDPETIAVCHSNYDLRWLILNGAPFAEGVQFHDTKVMAFMLDPFQRLSLDELCQRYLGVPKLNKPIRVVKDVVHMECSLGIVPIEDVPWAEMVEYNEQDIHMTGDLYTHLKMELQERGMWDRFFLAEEAPLSNILIEMEVAGLPIDAQGVSELLEHADHERQTLASELIEDTGVYGFKLTAPDSVAKFLYDELPTYKIQAEIPGFRAKLSMDLREVLAREFLPESVRIERIGTKFVYGTQTIEGLGLTAPRMKKKKGKMPKRPPIDAETLVNMHGGHPWVKKYLRWKSLNTLCNNYLEVWVREEHKGRLHGRFDQARTETGRIASRDPNLQSIPVSMDFNVRTLFQARMMIGDYSGLDARVAAHFSEDPVMLDIFRNDRDLYGTLASNAWGGPAEKSNPNRSLMKILMLSSQYGAQAGSIGDKMRIAGFEEKLCKNSGKLLRDMEETLETMFRWREDVLRDAMANGSITTISGRKRFLPDLYSNVWHLKARAERQCVASMVQGTSADIVRRAMIRIRQEIPPSVATMILQVHDEILWEIGPDWEEGHFAIIKSLAETAHEQDLYCPATGETLPGFPLLLPMKFEAAMGTSWEDKDAQGARSYRVMS